MDSLWQQVQIKVAEIGKEFNDSQDQNVEVELPSGAVPSSISNTVTQAPFILSSQYPRIKRVQKKNSVEV